MYYIEKLKWFVMKGGCFEAVAGDDDCPASPLHPARGARANHLAEVRSAEKMPFYAYGAPCGLFGLTRYSISKEMLS